jgi:hypothetical protein
MSGESSTKKILILAANPKDTSKLRLDEEVRAIKQRLRQAKARDTFIVESEWAVRTGDIQQSLFNFEPQIVHFCGHGVGEEGLAFENEAGQAKLLTATALAGLFKLFKSQVECVLLNACYSEVQAGAIAKHISCVIGMKQAIGDKAAIAFADGFYGALGAGRSLEDAFAFGCNRIQLETIPEDLTPVLKLKKRGKAGKVISEPETPPNPPLMLEQPEGQVPLGSRFYVDRPPIETDCYEAIVKPGALIRIKAPRQMGKTSLLSRILNQAEQERCRSVFLSFQEADGKVFADLDRCLQWFCAIVGRRLGIASQLSSRWDGIFGSKDNCTAYFEEYLLPAISMPLALGLDEVDQVFQYPDIAQDFFGLLRAWHERGKNETGWKRLRLVLVHSKEVYVPLNINQSPFNVGVPIELGEFSLPQVQDLAQRHGLCLNQEQIQQLMHMVGGHPYLVRVALHQLALQRTTLPHFLQVAPTEEGLYNDHLRRHLENLQADRDLLLAIKQVIATEQPLQIGSSESFKLRSMGLVKFQGNAVLPLCQLYRQYFRDRLQID